MSFYSSVSWVDNGSVPRDGDKLLDGLCLARLDHEGAWIPFENMQ